MKFVVTNVFLGDDGFDIVNIDDCEYIRTRSGGTHLMTHKGNCKYCIERSKK